MSCYLQLVWSSYLEYALGILTCIVIDFFGVYLSHMVNFNEIWNVFYSICSQKFITKLILMLEANVHRTHDKMMKNVDVYNLDPPPLTTNTLYQTSLPLLFDDVFY